MLAFLGLLVGLVLLFLGGDWLVKGSSRISQSMGISPLIVGLTVVAMGTSAPELLVSLSAALSGSSDISVGNIVGSNIANIGLILGLSGLIFPISVHVNLLKREIPIMIGVALLAVILFRDALVGRIDGLILLIGLFLFMGFVIVSARREQKETYHIPEELRDNEPEQIQRVREVLRLFVGIVVLLLGSQLTVSNATELARGFGVSELVIGITLVAVGTSLPELVTSITAARRRESDIAIGNVVGSNIFNILAILGITSLVQPIAVPQQTLEIDSLVMLGFSVLLLPFVLDRKLNRLEAIVLLLGYFGFVGYTVLVS